MKLTFFGHAAFGLETKDGVRILIDPFISNNPLSPVKVEDLQADYIIVTHGHDDHLGDTLAIADKEKTLIITVLELAHILAKKGYRTEAMQIGGAYNFEFGRLKFVMAFHGSATPDGQYAGLASGVLLTIEGKTIYHPGDTGLFYDMKLIGEMNKIDYMFVPIGGYFTMDITDGVKAAELVQPGCAIPMHYDTFDLIKADPQEYVEKVKKLGIDSMILKPGESITW